MQVELQMSIDMVPNANVWICNCIWLGAGMMKSCSPRLTFKSLLPKLSIFFSSDSSEPEASSKPQSKEQVHAQIPQCHLKVSRFQKRFCWTSKVRCKSHALIAGSRGHIVAKTTSLTDDSFKAVHQSHAALQFHPIRPPRAALVQSAVDWSHAWCCTIFFSIGNLRVIRTRTRRWRLTTVIFHPQLWV